MTIERLMSRDVHQCRPDHTLDYAASQMWEHDCGCLPVCSGDGEPRVIGMLPIATFAWLLCSKAAPCATSRLPTP